MTIPSLKSEYNPFVSIALTTYNGKEFLRQQLDSLLNQTYKNFEIVISDDNSDDITVGILNEYAKKDKRIRWSRSPFARGFIKNTENAINLCKGEIIFLCDQDDVWYPDKIQAHVDAYKDPTIYWVYNRLVLTDKNGVETGYLDDVIKNYYSQDKINLLYLTWGTCMGGAQTSYRADILHRAMPIGQYAPAHDSWIQLAIFPKKSKYIDKVLQTYRQHGANEVGWGQKMTPEQVKANEQKAIADNMNYLKHLPQNKNLQLWKRVFFKAVYISKLLRRLLRRDQVKAHVSSL